MSLNCKCLRTPKEALEALTNSRVAEGTPRPLQERGQSTAQSNSVALVAILTALRKERENTLTPLDS